MLPVLQRSGDHILFQIIAHIHLHNGSQCVCKACAQTYEGVFHKRGSSPEVSVPAGYKL